MSAAPVEAATEASLRARGNAAAAVNKLEEAVELYKQAVAVDDSSHKARHNMALAYMKMKNWTASLEAVNRAIAKSGADVEGKYHATRARVLVQLKRWDEAKVALDEARARGYDVTTDMEDLANSRRAPPPPRQQHDPPTHAQAPTQTGRGMRRPGGGGGNDQGANNDSDGRVSLGADGFPVVKHVIMPELPIIVEGALKDKTTPGYVKAIARVLLVVAALGYLIPFGPLITNLCFRSFFFFALSADIANLYIAYGMPSGEPNVFTPEGWKAVRDWAGVAMRRFSTTVDSPSICIAALNALSNAHPFRSIAFIPLGAVHAMYALEWLCDEAASPLARVAPAAASAAANLARTAADKLAPGLPAAGPLRRRALHLAIVHIQCWGEVLLVGALILLLFTPQRSLVSLAITCQCLYVRLLFSPLSRGVFVKIDAFVKAKILANANCPERAKTLYAYIATRALDTIKAPFTEATQEAARQRARAAAPAAAPATNDQPTAAAADTAGSTSASGLLGSAVASVRNAATGLMARFGGGTKID